MHAGKIRLFELVLQDIFQKLVDERDEARRRAEAAEAERDALKQRVQELERDVDYWKYNDLLEY